MVFLAACFGLILLPPLIGVLIADLTWWQVAALACAGALIGGYFTIRDSDTFKAYEWQWTVPSAPPAEAAFISAAKKLHAMRVAYAAEQADPPALHQAEAAICALPAGATDWVGRIAQTYLTDSGRSRSLAIAIRPHIIVRTAFFPDDTHTLIPVTAQPSAVVSKLTSGDVVRFDGRIVGHAGACPGDPPVTSAERLRYPDFLFAFSRVVRESAR